MRRDRRANMLPEATAPPRDANSMSGFAWAAEAVEVSPDPPVSGPRGRRAGRKARRNVR